MNRLLIALMIFQAGLVVSQDEFAIAHSNYAPSKTFLLNPTNTLDNRVWLDVHVLGAGTFVYNDYVFLKDTEFSFFSNVILGEEWPEYHYDPGLDKKSGYQDSDVQLISASIQYKEHGFAFATRARTYFDFRRKY